MLFEWFTIVFVWASVVVFFAAVGARIARISAMPLGLRWEVYPIPHEAGDRRRYGGSYMEELDWARKRAHRSFPARLVGFLAPEAVEIGTEILTMKKVRTNNRYRIWIFSTVLHWGIYLFIGWGLLLILNNLVAGAALTTVASVIGLAACILGVIGAAGLIFRRATTPDLARYTSPLDYFNLVFLALIFVSGLISWLGDPALAAHKAYAGSILAFRPAPAPWAEVLTSILFGLFLIYMPFSRLLHYVIKYFVYHQGLWDDEFMAPGSDAEKQVVRQLAYEVTWQAPHIVPGKSWQEEAQITTVQGEKK